VPIVAHETPGHTFGGVSFSVGGRCVFSGDTLFWEAVGPSHYPESEPARMASSVEQILSCCPPSALIFPGHGKPWTVADARDWWAAHRDNPPKLSLFGMSQANEDVPVIPKVEPGI
jgi:glyoxylase-like metal-dependent hydrolase (beta-lactamase superfamily II)